MPRKERWELPHKRDRERLVHMLVAARECTGFVAKRSRADLDTDRQLCRAVVNAIQEIGEAAARTSTPARSRVTGVPWGQIVEMRYIIIHVYWGVDLDLVWQTVTQDLPPFISALEHTLAQWPEENDQP